MPSALRTLATSLLSTIDTFEAVYSDAGAPAPSLDDPFVPSPLDSNPTLMNARNQIAALAAQIIVTARQPMDTIQLYGLSMYMIASLGFVVDVHIADILKEAGPQVSGFIQCNVWYSCIPPIRYRDFTRKT